MTEKIRGTDGRIYRKRRGVESAGIEQIKERKKAYHDRQREELWQMRSHIAAEQKAHFEALATPALEKLSADRTQTYQGLLAGQRDERGDLRQDQAQGERRHDVLGGISGATQPPVPLTAVQAAAYIDHARTLTARQAEFDQVRKETMDADRGRSLETGRDPLDAKPIKETTDRALEQQGKDRARESNRKADMDFYLKQRAADRARDRGGGRER